MTTTRSRTRVWRDRVARFVTRPAEDRALLALAWVVLGLARAVVLLVPLRRLAPRIGHPVPAVDPDLRVDLADKVGRAVRTAAQHTPWWSSCYAQALAALVLRRGTPSTLWFGVSRPDGAGLAAHAWLSGDAGIVVGGNEASAHAPIAAFRTRP